MLIFFFISYKLYLHLIISMSTLTVLNQFTVKSFFLFIYKYNMNRRSSKILNHLMYENDR